MALSIGTNTSALDAAASASAVNRSLETSMERLSTGKRINSASDDAEGVAIASRLTAEIRGTNQSIRNALDAQALIDLRRARIKRLRIFYKECERSQCNRQMIQIMLRTEVISL